jgi:hypothetical protein
VDSPHIISVPLKALSSSLGGTHNFSEFMTLEGRGKETQDMRWFTLGLTRDDRKTLTAIIKTC